MECLLEHIICQDIVNIVMHADDKSVNVLPVQNTFLDDNIAFDAMKIENDHLMELLTTWITKENADTLRDIVEQARTSNPLDNAFAYACMYTKQIQELLVYVSDTCPSSPSRSEKLVVVPPMNKARKVTFAKTSTTSENNTQNRVDLHKTQTTNKPLVPSTSVKSSTNASGSIPRSTTKNTRILQTSSSNQKYQRVEAHTRSLVWIKEIVCHHFLYDNVQKGNISIEKVSSEDNIADILTKPLKRESFNYLRLGLGMMEQID
ncbi:hypothetical protein Tco_0044514 [Tanacetum coccineum]